MDEFRVLVVDDHPVLREGLINTLESDRFSVVGTGATTDEAVELAHLHLPDILILDVEMPGRPIVDSVRRIRSVSPGTRIVMLTMHTQHALRSRLLDAGASDVISKSLPTAQLIERLAAVDPPIRRDREIPRVLLTEREQEVLRLVERGRSNRQIGVDLSVSEGTARRHLANSFEKLGAHSRTEAVRLARLLGYL